MTEIEGPSDQWGLLDTSIFIAQESGRPLGVLPRSASVSVITLAELSLGVLMATDPNIRQQRQRTLSIVESRFDPIPISPAVARVFAEILAEARLLGRQPKIMDSWIAATAIAHGLPVYTQDDDFNSISRVISIRV